MRFKVFLLCSLLGSILQAQEPYRKIVVAQDGSGQFEQIWRAVRKAKPINAG